MRILSLSLFLLFALVAHVQAQIAVTQQRSEDAMPLITTKSQAVIVVDTADALIVTTAANLLASDVEAVSGRRPSVANCIHAGDMPIVAGTVGSSPLIDALISSGKVDASVVHGRWEAYTLQLIRRPMKGVKQALVVMGGTPRGTAYGLLELSRLMGVSPWVWWADVVPPKADELYITGKSMTVGEPSVKYRGIFINDEDWGLHPWASKGIDSKYGNIGPNTYARVMELLLRLRANTLWPAMHPCSQAFWDNKDNLPVAKKYDIMLGSSHCEQMMRDNEWEWRRPPYNGTNEDWNYVTNTAKIQGYWEERVKESVGFDCMYTLGMRGVHDWGISGYPSTEDKVRGLTDIINFQRSLIQRYVGNPKSVPQLFIPYKEVLDAYNAGLRIPDDVTLCWVDDNHGYIRQLPNADEQARSGGNGVYYHISYWGTPEDYLWLCSHSPSLISYELTKAYSQGIRTLWVINVGDIKPAEMELEFCMDLAWDVNSWAPCQAEDYIHTWAARTFGGPLANDIAEIKREYYRLAAAGKPEHVHRVAYTSDEKDRRIADYAAISRKVDNIKPRVPDALQDAFFQLVEYPVKGAYYMNVKVLRASQSLELAHHGQLERAFRYAGEANNAYRQIEALTKVYNTTTAQGKWNGIMNHQPRGRDQFKAPHVATDSDVATMTASAESIGRVIIPATAFKTTSGNISVVNGLGLDRASITVWPLDMNAYTDVSKAPFAQYCVDVKPGNNRIHVRMLPTFPINSSYDLRVAVAIDGQRPVVHSIKTVATRGNWNTNVLQGYADVVADYTSVDSRSIDLRVSFMDPGVVMSQIMVESAATLRQNPE